MIGFHSSDSSPERDVQPNVVKFPRFKRCEAKKRILIADDVDDIRLMLRHTIHNTFPQVQVTEASSGMMASIELKRNAYDLVISDVNMLNGDGIWLHFMMEQFHPDTPLVFFACSPEHIPPSARSRKAFAKTDSQGLMNELLHQWDAHEAK